MGTRTVDENRKRDRNRTDTGVGREAVTGAGAGNEHDEAAVDATEADAKASEAERRREASRVTGPGADRGRPVGQGAAAVLSAALGLVSPTGSWLGTVAAARETLLGQLETAADAGVATQVKEVYGDAWNTSALWGGLFALTALIVGVAVLVRPAFGTPGRTVRAP